MHEVIHSSAKHHKACKNMFWGGKKSINVLNVQSHLNIKANQITLIRHLKYHTSSLAKKCPKCKTLFRCSDHFKSHQGICFYGDNNQEFIPSFCGTSNNSCETSLRTDDYQTSCEDQIVPSSEQENTLGEQHYFQGISATGKKQ